VMSLKSGLDCCAPLSGGSAASKDEETTTLAKALQRGERIRLGAPNCGSTGVVDRGSSIDWPKKRRSHIALFCFVMNTELDPGISTATAIRTGSFESRVSLVQMPLQTRVLGIC
jgi:hypothetical protein